MNCQAPLPEPYNKSTDSTTLNSISAYLVHPSQTEVLTLVHNLQYAIE